MRLVVILLSVAVAQSLQAAENYVSGKISNITSVSSGLMIMIDPERKVPDNCIGSPYNWMLIKEENKTMVSVALTSWVLGRGATVYTTPRTSGYCIISQIDPYEP